MNKNSTYYEILKAELAKPKIYRYIKDNLLNNDGFFVEHFDARVQKILSIFGYIKKNPEKYKEAWLKWASEKNAEILEEKKVKESENQKEIKGLEETENDLNIFTVQQQVMNYYEKNPYFLDKAKNFFLWNKKEFKYELSDEVDVLNGISGLGVNVLNSKTRAEILNGLRQYGRKKIPKKIPDSWIQFRENIVDFKTGEELKASPEYFITNPIPWDIGDSEETPTMDKLILEWVGEKYKKTLFEIIAYCCSNEQFMQNLIALVGGGANGKGTFLKLLGKLIGKDNLASSELRELSGNQFETASIYKKLVVVLGEVSYDDLRNTNQIKKLSGEDSIRFCFKGKTPFTDKSISTIIVATNSLPKTPDKTIGFYRRWLIIDFKNQFPIKSGILDTIPEIEYNNLAKKILRILKELYEKQEFYNQGTYEEKQKKYEERSNPIMNFVEKYCVETLNENLELRVFSNKFNEYAKRNHLRLFTVRQITKTLREEGFETGKRRFVSENTETSKQFILNLCLRIPRIPRIPKFKVESHRESNVNSSILGISGIPSIKKPAPLAESLHIKNKEDSNFDEMPEKKPIKKEPVFFKKKTPENLNIQKKHIFKKEDIRDTKDTFHKKENTQQLPDFHKSGMEEFRKK